MILQSIKMATKAICSNKMRSFLTMLGIIIGVVSLVVLVSLVNGSTSSITDTINSMGSNMLSVTITDDKDQPLKLDELDTFIESEWISAVAPVTQSSVTASSAYSEETISIIGTNASLDEVEQLTLQYGRFIMKPDLDNHSNVVVINADLATDVIGRQNAVGETLQLDGKNFLIIGVLDDNDSNLSFSGSGNYYAYIPYTSFIRLVDGVSLSISSFEVLVNGDDMDAAEIVLEKSLLSRFGNDEDAYSIISQSAIAEAMSSVTDTLSLLLGGIAGISLLVGGIGIMNIMLVSVTERTREIGIRKAIGASYMAILQQFLIEALMLSLIGCFIGILFSQMIITAVNIIGNVSYSLSMGVVSISVIFSLTIGLIFGLYPAGKAASMKPIDALRYN